MTNEKELEALFKRHYRQMYRTAMLMLHDDAESKDIVHDVFAQLMALPAERLGELSTASYLQASVRNRCLNVIRGRKIQERVRRLYLLDLDTTILPNNLSSEQLKALTEGIGLLSPPVCREIIEQHFCLGLTFRETALRLGVSETTVYKHLRSALRQLRTHIKKKGLA